jgi:hypothetical protein
MTSLFAVTAKGYGLRATDQISGSTSSCLAVARSPLPVAHTHVRKTRIRLISPQILGKAHGS